MHICSQRSPSSYHPQTHPASSSSSPLLFSRWAGLGFSSCSWTQLQLLRTVVFLHQADHFPSSFFVSSQTVFFRLRQTVTAAVVHSPCTRFIAAQKTNVRSCSVLKTTELKKGLLLSCEWRLWASLKVMHRRTKDPPGVPSKICNLVNRSRCYQ